MNPVILIHNIAKLKFFKAVEKTLNSMKIHFIL